jgi:hypothetical protein
VFVKPAAIAAAPSAGAVTAEEASSSPSMHQTPTFHASPAAFPASSSSFASSLPPVVTIPSSSPSSSSGGGGVCGVVVSHQILAYEASPLGDGSEGSGSGGVGNPSGTVFGSDSTRPLLDARPAGEDSPSRDADGIVAAILQHVSDRPLR